MAFHMNTQAPHVSPIRILISGPLAWSDATRNVAPWTLEKVVGWLCCWGIPHDLGQLGSFFRFFLRVGHTHVSFSWKGNCFEWARWRMGKEGWRWLLGKTSRLLVYMYIYLYREVQSWIVFVLSSHLLHVFVGGFQRCFDPNSPKGSKGQSLCNLLSVSMPVV